jgi:hypothetical protein
VPIRTLDLPSADEFSVFRDLPGDILRERRVADFRFVCDAIYKLVNESATLGSSEERVWLTT